MINLFLMHNKTFECTSTFKKKNRKIKKFQLFSQWPHVQQECMQQLKLKLELYWNYIGEVFSNVCNKHNKERQTNKQSAFIL